MSLSQPHHVAEKLRAAQAEALEFAIAVARLAADHRTEDVVVLDLRGLSSVADFFVLGTGTSERQMRAALERIDEYAAGIKRSLLTPLDRRSASWLLADYVDVVVHLFDREHRSYYDLDGLWGDARRVPWQLEANGENTEASDA